MVGASGKNATSWAAHGVESMRGSASASFASGPPRGRIASRDGLQSRGKMSAASGYSAKTSDSQVTNNSLLEWFENKEKEMHANRMPDQSGGSFGTLGDDDSLYVEVAHGASARENGEYLKMQEEEARQQALRALEHA